MINVTIKAYTHDDYPEINNWVCAHYGTKISSDYLCENGTFILFLNDTPALCLTTLLTQSKQMAYVFNFIKNPEFKNKNLEVYGKRLWEHCFNFAKERGYKNIICFADNEALAEKYSRFGMKRNLEHLTSFIKEL